MRKVIFVKKSKFIWTIATVVLVVTAGAYVGWRLSEAASKPASAEASRVIHLVTGEFVATLDNGKKIEVYRWDPGTVIVPKGEQVELRITGVSGGSHPFIIEGLGVTGEVRKGKTAVVRFVAEKAGTYPIICQTHTDSLSGGPMVGYIVVQ
jgi:heme/copper-type cytochrome/quinol oxidase subunit 2